jgi:hypothetical protein
MIKNIVLITLITLRVFYQPANTKENIAPFASPSPLPPTTILATPAKVVSINGHISNNKVMLQWVVTENEQAAQFEVEKSADGKTFSMAALVFGTDKTLTDNYQFYEKAGKKKIIYRVKIINKNQTIEYSPVIEIDPKA